ncbi:hypothetical protein BDY24DRAFT_234267 [Mrakia frigida]|uniref:uncharacterized protein n=1 Tax=Mrakia frigida TaxID=29902 RepID=UPI003FCC0E8D
MGTRRRVLLGLFALSGQGQEENDQVAVKVLVDESETGRGEFFGVCALGVRSGVVWVERVAGGSGGVGGAGGGGEEGGREGGGEDGWEVEGSFWGGGDRGVRATRLSLSRPFLFAISYLLSATLLAPSNRHATLQ